MSDLAEAQKNWMLASKRKTRTQAMSFGLREKSLSRNSVGDHSLISCFIHIFPLMKLWGYPGFRIKPDRKV